MADMRDQFIATVKELFETDEHTFSTTHGLGYYNTVRSNTYQGRAPAKFSDVQMLWEVFRAATLAAQAQQPSEFLSCHHFMQLHEYTDSQGDTWTENSLASSAQDFLSSASKAYDKYLQSQAQQHQSIKSQIKKLRL